MERLNVCAVTITSESEQLFIAAMLQGEENLYWIGLSYGDSDWNWVNGESLIYTNWGEGEPSRGFDGQEQFVQIYGKTHEEFSVGEWNDTVANYDGVDEFWRIEQVGFICEYE